jgi:hypothetical protein
MDDVSLRFQACASILITFPDKTAVTLSSEHLAQLLTYLIVTDLLGVQIGKGGQIYQDLLLDLIEDEDGGFVIRVVSNGKSPQNN